MKKLIGMLGILSFVAIAGTLSDIKFLSDKFMDDNIEIAREEAPVKRHIASDLEINSDRIHFPVNEENSLRINGFWVAKKYTYNYNEGEELNLKIKLELVGNGLVMIQNDEDQILDIIKLTDDNKMRLSAKLDGGQETLDVELFRAEENIAVVEDVVESEEEIEAAQQNMDNIDLVVVSAQNPTKHKAPKTGTDISGSILVVDGVIEELNVTVDNASINISGVEIKTAGIFNTEHDGQSVSGRYKKLSENNITIKFFSGPLAATNVEFATEDVRESKLETLEEHENEKERLFSGEVVYDRTTDKMELVAETSEEMDEKADESGFTF